MLIKNVNIFTDNHSIKYGSIYIKNGIIEDIITEEVVDSLKKYPYEEVVDGDGLLAIPGLIDIHLHGAAGYDFSDGDVSAIFKIAEYELKAGITSFLPATMTLPLDKIKQIIEGSLKYLESPEMNAHKSDFLGINLEGPFISKEKCGAQNPENILPLDAVYLEELMSKADGLIKIVGLSPEKENAVEFIQRYKDKTILSIAHSNGDYDISKKAMDEGVVHITHLFNAMPDLLHRNPGVVGAFLDDKTGATAELICDGEHVHPALIRTVFELKPQNLILISDSMRATGLSDGGYDLGGQEVSVNGNRATLIKDGSLAGSVSNLAMCMKKAINEMNIPLEKVILAVTENPAKRLSLFDRVGSLSKGKKADIVLLNKEKDIVSVIKNGILIR